MTDKNSDYEIKIKDCGKAVFKAKGKKTKLKKEIDNFFNYK